MSQEVGVLFSLKDEFSGKVDGIKGKVKETEGAFGKLKDGAGKVGGVMKKAAKGFAVVSGAGVATFAAVNKVVGGFDDIAKTAPKLGVSTDALQEMDYWAGQNGISSEDAEKAIGRLNQRIGEARDGNEKYSNALKDTGVNMDAVKDGTLSTEDAMAQSIQGLSEMTNEQDKAALASELFGKKLGRELMPALQDGSLSLEDAKKKAEELGIVIDGDTLESAEVFADTWDDLSRTMSIFGQNVLADLMPAFQTMMEWVIENMPMIKEKITNAFEVAWGVIEPMLPSMKEGLELAGDAVKYIWEKAQDMYHFIADNWGAILPIVAGVTGAFVAYKAIVMLSEVWTGLLAVKAGILAMAQGGLAGAQGVLNAVMAANPMAVVALAIGALIAIGVVLYKNWDKIKAKTQELWDKFKETSFIKTVTSLFESMGKQLSKVGDFFGGIKDKFLDLKDSLTSFTPPKWISSIGGAVGGAVSKTKGWIEDNFAVGTDRVPHDMVAQIHKDEMIVPAKQSKNLRQQGVNINNIDKGGRPQKRAVTTTAKPSGGSINIAKLADQIIVREEADIDKFAEMFVEKLKKASFNMA